MKVVIDSQTIDSKGFENEFIEKSKGRKIESKVGPSKFRVDRAGDSLDKVITEEALNDIVELADDFSEEKYIHPDNRLLGEKNEFESRISKLKVKKQTNNED
jgi:hypothetical protein